MFPGSARCTSAAIDPAVDCGDLRAYQPRLFRGRRYAGPNRPEVLLLRTSRRAGAPLQAFRRRFVFMGACCPRPTSSPWKSNRMSRRRRAETRKVLPDPKFGDLVVTKFMNYVMYEGKKAVA